VICLLLYVSLFNELSVNKLYNMERGNDRNNELETRWKEGSWPNLRY
jgi:hypothetical protein